EHIKQAAVSENRINPRLADFAQHGHTLGRVFVDENRHVRIPDETSVVKTLLNQLLGFFEAEIAHVDVVDERQVQIGIIADPGFRSQLWNSVDVDFHKVTRSQFDL